VVFAGFVGYSLMITVFTPMIMSNHNFLLPPDEPMSRRVIVLGFLLCLYPLGQFVGSPVLGALSDRFGRKPVLMIHSLSPLPVMRSLASHFSFAVSLSLVAPHCWRVWRRPTWWQRRAPLPM
jgi:MFS family permease